METSKRGLDTFYSQPPRAYLDRAKSFGFQRRDLRITFYERDRDGRNPTWDGVVHRTGRSYCAYAGTSETFDIEKVVRKLIAQLTRSTTH